MSRLLTGKQVQERWQVSRWTLGRLRTAKKLRAIRLRGGLRYREEDLAAFEAENFTDRKVTGGRVKDLIRRAQDFLKQE